VLVDFENVQPSKIAALNGSSAFKVKVFLGANQTKLPVDMALALQRLGSHAEYIQIDGNGSNALDFHIAFYIGRLAAQTPDAEFEIISKDKGFDPLIRHLGSLGIRCRRSESFSGGGSGATVRADPVADPVDSAMENLHKRKAAKPRTLKTLRTSLHTLFANKLSADAIELVIRQLERRGVIRVIDGKIQYQLPAQA
jgi:hypothetical protein